MVIRIPMSQLEFLEGINAGIFADIMGKMTQGHELSDSDKSVVRSKGKVYVLGHTKKHGRTKVKPQLRNSPKGGWLSEHEYRRKLSELSFKHTHEQAELKMYYDEKETQIEAKRKKDTAPILSEYLLESDRLKKEYKMKEKRLRMKFDEEHINLETRRLPSGARI